MAKNMEADNFQKVPRKSKNKLIYTYILSAAHSLIIYSYKFVHLGSEVSSDDSSGDDASVCLQPEAKRNSFLSGIADIINTMFDKKFASK